MTPKADRQFIQTKLIFIAKRLEYLKKYSNVTIEELSADFERLKAVEKVIQEIVDCAVDVNQYVAENTLNVEIRSNKDSFWKIQAFLKREDEYIKQLVDTVSFRNEIVHSYDAGVRVVWKRRSVGYFVDVYASYARDVNSLIPATEEA
jgi:uncharacterized protein YutE (UPF0331/DUF86 family)